MVIFGLVALSVVSAIHFYIWQRLVLATQLPHVWRLVGTVLISLFALSIPLAMILGRFFHMVWARELVWIAFIWLGAMFWLLSMLALWEPVRIWGALSQYFEWRSFQLDESRRLFLSRTLAGGSLFMTLGLVGYGLKEALRIPSVTRVKIKLKRLPADFDGLRLVQLSDIHVGPTLGIDFVRGVVERVNELNPDIVAITGDLVDGGVGHLRQCISPLGDLKSRYGVYFVTGNHEYYAGVEPWLDELRKLGVRVLRNERVRIGTDEVGFDLAGVDDWRAQRVQPDHGPDLQKALMGRHSDDELVLLAHQPKQIVEAAAVGVGLLLSGHTHGGQIFPFGYLVRLDQPYISGLHQHEETQIYVNRGTGYWGPPLRVGAPGEISLLELYSEGSA